VRRVKAALTDKESPVGTKYEATHVARRERIRVVSVEERWAIKPSRVRQEKDAQEAISNAKEVLASAG